MISNECKILKANAKISKIYAELSFGMAVTRNGEKIFFSDETSFGYRTRSICSIYEMLKIAI